MSVSPDLMRRFINAAADQLQGNWIIIGGALLHLLNCSSRPTEDIDLAGPLTATQSDTLKLMELAESLCVPVEAINQAGAFFLRKVPGWETKLILIQKGSAGAIFRPNLELYFALKLARLTESDTEDCISYLEYSVANKENFDVKTLIALCEQKIQSPEKKIYKSRLIKALRSV